MRDQVTKLSVREKEQVALLKETEAFAECKTDTSRTSMDFTGGNWLRMFETLPIRGEGESSCIGFRGPELPLYSGASANSAVIGAIRAGDDPLYGHIPEGRQMGIRNDWRKCRRLDQRQSL